MRTGLSEEILTSSAPPPSKQTQNRDVLNLTAPHKPNRRRPGDKVSSTWEGGGGAWLPGRGRVRPYGEPGRGAAGGRWRREVISDVAFPEADRSGAYGG